jgi:hypothetical protein
VDGGARTLLHSPNGSFDFTNLVVSGGNVEPGREDVVSDALEFHVGVQIGDVETPGLKHCQNRLDLTEEGCFVSVEYGSNRAELNFARDSMKKGVALDVEMSIQSVTSLWCCKIKLGTCTGLKVGTCWEGPFVVFLLRAATSGPYMSRARLASSTVTGQFRMRFLPRICSNCC